MKTILLTLPLVMPYRARLDALPGVIVREVPAAQEFGSALIYPAELLHGVHMLLCKAPPKNFNDLDSLELLQIGTVGYEHLKDLGFANRSVTVCNARGVFDTAIAEWNLAMMINLVRDVRTMLHNQNNHLWNRADRFQEEIRGRTVGIWGYAGIGRDTARLAKAFGMNVHVLTRSGRVGPRLETFTLPGSGDPLGTIPDRVFGPEQRFEFLSGLDFLILALPRTRESTGLIGEPELRALPKTAFVLNPSRGPIIQEQPLIRALSEGWIAGAALDTHFAYPLPSEHPLWGMPNVILTPHISGADKSRLFLPRIGELFVENVERFLTNRPLLNVVTAREWNEA